jgi:hypothetical protein
MPNKDKLSAKPKQAERDRDEAWTRALRLLRNVLTSN